MKNLKGFLLNIVYKMYEIIHQQGFIPQSGSGHIRMLNLILSRLVSKQQLKKQLKQNIINFHPETWLTMLDSFGMTAHANQSYVDWLTAVSL